MDMITEQPPTAQVQNIDQESHLGVALDLKHNLLKRIEYVANIPQGFSLGRAEKVSKSMRSHFSMNSPAKITGDITIEKMTGLLRLKVASSDNLLYQQQTISVEGQVETKAGELLVFSPIDIDFWTMATLFVDHQEKRRPDGHELRIKGYQVIRVKPNKPQKFQAKLLAMSNNYQLILAAPTSASNVTIKLK